MSLQRLLSITLIASACGPGKPGTTADDTATSAASSTTVDDTSATNATSSSTSTSDPEPTSDPGTNSPPNPAGFTTEDSNDPSATSIVTTAATTGDGTTGEPVPCDLSLQDCPEGQKCSVVAMSPDDLFQGHFECVPLDPNPVPPHAPCDVFADPADGTDNCDLGAICLFPDAGGIGECFSFCNFAMEPICQVPGDLCVGATCQTCTWSFCDSSCNVLDPDACDPDQLCAPGGDLSWQCIADSSGADGQHGDVCEFVNDCDPGFVCMQKDELPTCEGPSCCAMACDVDAPNTCPDKDLGGSCKPWYPPDQAPTPELAKVGVCALP